METQTAASTKAKTPTFDDLFEGNVTRVWRTLRRLGVSDADADDCTQEVFVVIHRQLSGFESRSSIETWIYGICLRVAAQHRRSARVRREVLVGEVREDSFDGDQEDVVQRTQARAVLDEVLSGLDDDKRRAFVLHDLEELGMKEIAEIEQCPVQTGYYRLHAARAFVESAIAERSAFEFGVASARRDAPSHARRQRVALAVGALTGASLLATNADAAALPPSPAKLAFMTTPKWLGLGAVTIACVLAYGLLPRGADSWMATAQTRPSAEIPSAEATPANPSSTSATPVVSADELAAARAPEDALAAAPNAAVPTPSEGFSSARQAWPASPRSPSTLAQQPLAPAASAEPTEALPSEGALLSSAQAALGRDPAGAYSITERHLGLFGASSPLSQEREMIAIEALRALSRTDDAEARARRFVEQHPRSSHARRLRTLFENLPTT